MSDLSHLHIPDGVLPLWLIGAGWLVAIVMLTVADRRVRGTEMARRVPLVGAVSALMLVGMSTEVVPIAYHINLTVIGGILLGPWLSMVAAFVTVIILALAGHGGVTVAGLNATVIATEMVAGWALFSALTAVLGTSRPRISAGVATVLALALSTTMLVGIVALGGAPATHRESGAFDPATLSFSNPFSEGVVANTLVAAEAHAEEDAEPVGGIAVRRFAITVYTLGAAGWLLEALIIAAIVGFVARVRPGLIFEGALAQPARAPIGDEGLH